MEYIISEDNLIDFVFAVLKNTDRLVGLHVKDFLKSKQPVEVLIKYTMKKGENLSQVLWQLIEDRYKSGDNIKIYIQKVNE